MNDLAAVRIVQRLRHLPQDGQRLRQRKLAPLLLSPPTQIHSLHQLQDQVVIPARCIALQIPDRGDVLVHQLGNQLKILPHLLHLAGVVGQLRRQRLERHFDPAHFVQTPVNHPHPALAEFAQYAVAAHQLLAGLEPPRLDLPQRRLVADGQRFSSVVERGLIT